MKINVKKLKFKLFKRIQNDIYIISNLLLDFFNRLTQHHSIYSQILIPYNHEIVNVIKIQNSLFLLNHPYRYLNCEYVHS
jgi:hypothetical protein